MFSECFVTENAYFLQFLVFSCIIWDWFCNFLYYLDSIATKNRLNPRKREFLESSECFVTGNARFLHFLVFSCFIWDWFCDFLYYLDSIARKNWLSPWKLVFLMFSECFVTENARFLRFSVFSWIIWDWFCDFRYY